MNIERYTEGDKLKLVLHGQVDTATSPVLEEKLADLEGYQGLELDFTDVPYVSSAGLRALLTARKTLEKKENIVLTGVNEDVLAVLEMTGFLDFMTVNP